ncbi:MAG: hypothetical protein ACOX41_05870 [Anaerovoracaceae bacterium]|jgi:hypothetical protein
MTAITTAVLSYLSSIATPTLGLICMLIPIPALLVTGAVYPGRCKSPVFIVIAVILPLVFLAGLYMYLSSAAVSSLTDIITKTHFDKIIVHFLR